MVQDAPQTRSQRPAVTEHLTMKRRRVLIAYKSLPQYRVPFFESLRKRLAEDGIDLSLIYGMGSPRDADRNEGAHVDWGIQRGNRVLRSGKHELIWQPCLREAAHVDLVVVEQASRLLVNYVLLGLQSLGVTKVAFWGHGANLQASRADALSERLKRRVSRLPHWWFAYTDGSRDRVVRLGFPLERVTVVQNVQDTERLSRAVAAIGPEENQCFRLEHGLGDGPIGLFLGSLSRAKRVDVLIEASSRIVEERPDFRLLIAGDGTERGQALAAAKSHAWLKYLGRVSDFSERARLLAAADVLLVPEAAGLTVLDSFAAGVPLVTTNVTTHGPEIEYVISDVNGVVVEGPNDVATYTRAVLDVVTESERRDRLVRGCVEARARYTLAEMVDRFACGVKAALDAS
jgi:glycosyltransferase involved in cell wall biosynthesis